MTVITKFTLVFYAPPPYIPSLKRAIFAAGAGRYSGPGSYTDCCWETSGTGQFRPGASANPAIGRVGEVETVEEVRVETVIYGEENVQKVVAALKKAHPYEEAAYQVTKVEDF